jgi:hypothetical protein
MPEPLVIPRRKTLELAAAFALIAAAICIADAPIFGNRFVNWDDQDTLYRNPDFNPPALSKLATYWSRPHGRIYVPVTYTFWWGLAEMSSTPGPPSRRFSRRQRSASSRGRVPRDGDPAAVDR